MYGVVVVGREEEAAGQKYFVSLTSLQYSSEERERDSSDCAKYKGHQHHHQTKKLHLHYSNSDSRPHQTGPD